MPNKDKKDNYIFEVKELFFIPTPDTANVVEIGDDSFQYFYIAISPNPVPGSDQIVDKYDYIYYYGDLRMDYKNGAFRVYPGMHDGTFFYSTKHHMAYSKSVRERIENILFKKI